MWRKLLLLFSAACRKDFKINPDRIRCKVCYHDICAVGFCWKFVVSDYFESPTILLKGALTGENCVTQTNTLLPVEMNFVDLILWSTGGNMLENIFRKYLFHPPSYWGWLTAVTDLYGKKCPHPQPRPDRMQKHNDSQENLRI